MRRDPHDKPRRLFVLPGSSFLTVTMRGCFDLVEQSPLRCKALRTAPAGGVHRQMIDDAWVLSHSDGASIVAGRSGESGQVLMLRLQGQKVCNFCSSSGRRLNCSSQLVEQGAFDRPSPADKLSTRGVSVVCAMPQPRTFCTGGYDHAVHHWSISDDEIPTPTLLAIKHTSAVHALLPTRDTGEKLLSGSADHSISVYDMASERVLHAFKVSNPVYQLHTALSPFCTLVEVSTARRFSGYVLTIASSWATANSNSRYGIVERPPSPRSPSSDSDTAIQRYMGDLSEVKIYTVSPYRPRSPSSIGAVHENRFACGGSEKDGIVRLWDLRNPSKVEDTVRFCFPL